MPDQTVLITGGTGLFGSAIALHLAARGWTVVITTREVGKAEALLEKSHSSSGTLMPIAFEYSSDDDLVSLLKSLRDRKIRITHLVNNARSLSSLSVGEDGITSSATFMTEFGLDVVLPYELSMRLAKSGEHDLSCIVNIGSQYGEVAPNPALYEGSLARSPVQYGVSKAALHHLTRELAARLAPWKIRVNCVAFGGVEGRVDDGFKKRYASMVPLERMLNVEEVPGPVHFLLSDESSSVNGHVLIADGGWSIW